MNEKEPGQNSKSEDPNSSDRKESIVQSNTEEGIEKKTESITNKKSESPQTKAPGEISLCLTKLGLIHQSLNDDHIGIEVISVKPDALIEVITFLKKEGFDYLECQGGYDEGPGKNLVCFYHLISISNSLKIVPNQKKAIEVRIKVFLPRDGDLKVPSIYKIFKGADWQERETFDMFGIIFEGHPHPKRLLMPEDWKGWPLRKDYIQPDFYEMQDAY